MKICKTNVMRIEKMVADYEKRYEGLDKIFYPKEMFTSFAQQKGC